jgi:hypothetical protein
MIQINLSIHFLNAISKMASEIPSKSCEFREEIFLSKHRHVLSDNASHNKIETSLMEPNWKSIENIKQFWESLTQKIFETSELHAVWHYLHKWQNDTAPILNEIQELVIEYVRYNMLH